MDLKGTFTALITPFLKDQLDEEGLIQNIRMQLKAKVAGIVFLGTTGETATLSEEEQDTVIKIAIKEAKGKTLVIVGTGSNSTQKTIENTKKAEALGADIALIVTPYYNKPPQEGLYQHYKAIAANVNIPVLVYNIQGRTGVNIKTSTLLKIAALPNIIGVKESSGSLEQVADVLQTVKKKYPSFNVLSGDDGMTLPMMALGATGVISVVSNLVPERIVALVNAALEGRFHESRKEFEKLFPLFTLAFIEVNPIPIKQAMNLCGLAAGDCRLPLCKMKQENQEALAKVLSKMGLK